VGSSLALLRERRGFLDLGPFDFLSGATALEIPNVSREVSRGEQSLDIPLFLLTFRLGVGPRFPFVHMLDSFLPGEILFRIAMNLGRQFGTQ
jgi:hypothetical protein